MTGIEVVDTALAVGRLESDRAAESALRRRRQEAQIARNHAEQIDRQEARKLAERRMARLLGS